MLIRVVIENLLSFKHPTELNTFPAPIKSKSHHKNSLKEIEFLKVNAIYGANGAGKSNIVKAIDFLQEAVSAGYFQYRMDPFRLDKDYHNKKRSKIDIEFIYKNIFFYYEVTFKDNVILKETLWKDSNTSKPSVIFERTTLSKSKTIKLNINEEYVKTEKDKIRIDILQEDVITPLELVLSNRTMRNVIKEIDFAYTWITSRLTIIDPTSQIRGLVGRLLYEKKFFNYMNTILPFLDTGIQKITIKESLLESYFGEDEKDEIERIKKSLDDAEEDSYMSIDTSSGEVAAVKKNEKYFVNHIQLFHNCKEKNKDNLEPFEIIEESDGTQRLFDLIPMTYELLYHEKTFIVDEIESSIHPVLIKELFSKVFEKAFKGQLIFTTHESSLLDLDIFRQDEIWFAEKNQEGATKYYPLSDFKPRFDLDIRKGYLNGRFGAIPFLGNFKELKWEKMHEEE